MFADRLDAARQLAAALAHWRGRDPLVLAIPRGAVPMGIVLAQALEGTFDLVLVRKLRAPHSAEFAVGAVDETGWVHLAEYAREAGADSAYLAHETAEQLAVLRRRRAQYTPARASVDPAGRIVIVVDDGLATGATMVAALHAVRAHGPLRLICAVPVASAEGLDAVRPWADEVVCLQTPHLFDAVGQFYRDFRQVEDDEVIRLLAGHPMRQPTRDASPGGSG